MNQIINIPDICGMGLSFQLDGFQVLYAVITTFMWVETLLFSIEYMKHGKKKGRYYLFTVLTYAATMGVFLSADFYTTFIFFEIMSFTSYVWVAQDEKPESLKAAATYLAVAVIGGMVMLMGLFLLYSITGTLRFDELAGVISEGGLFLSEVTKNRLYAAGFCMLFGFGAKAGMFPLHIWLPKAHPVAPAPASALLSGVLTKAGVFGILVLTARIFAGDVLWGTLILTLGVITMAGGAILALCSVDFKRTLACSSMSQIGFILVGIGMQSLLAEHNLLAVWGSVLHMVNHSLIKLALFMAAGVVYLNLHKLDLNEIQGFGKKKPLLKFIFVMGALGIAGVPLWNGYVSKTLLHEAIVEYRVLLTTGSLSGITYYGVTAMTVIEWIFLLSGGLTVAYMLKLFVCIFVEDNKEEKKQEQYNGKGAYMSTFSAFVLTLSAVILPIMGCFPQKVMQPLAEMSQSFLGNHHEAEEIAYFSLTNLKGAGISLIAGILIYGLIVRKFLIRDGRYVDVWPKWMDLENSIYRPLLLTILPLAGTVICRFLDRLVDNIIVFLRKTMYKDSPIPQELAEGNTITHALGHSADAAIHMMNETIWIDHKMEENKEHKLVVLYHIISENNTIIGRSLSFGLIMSLLGLLAVLVYLLARI